MTDTAVADTARQDVEISTPAPGVALVTLNRPDRMNALGPSTVRLFTERVSKVAADPEVRAVVLTGAGRAFCSGMDLAAASEMPPQERSAATEWMRGMHSGSLLLDSLPQPVIAAVNGPAIGGGFGIALGCDIRIADPAAMFSATFVKMALGPDAGLSHTLPRLIGHARALELLLTADRLDAAQALELGLVSRVVDDPLSDAVALAARIATVPGYAAQKIKATLRASAAADMTTALRDIEPATQAELICHPEFFTHALAWLQSHNFSKDELS